MQGGLGIALLFYYSLLFYGGLRVKVECGAVGYIIEGKGEEDDWMDGEIDRLRFQSCLRLPGEGPRRGGEESPPIQPEGAY